VYSCQKTTQAALGQLLAHRLSDAESAFRVEAAAIHFLRSA